MGFSQSDDFLLKKEWEPKDDYRALTAYLFEKTLAVHPLGRPASYLLASTKLRVPRQAYPQRLAINSARPLALSSLSPSLPLSFLLVMVSNFCFEIIFTEELTKVARRISLCASPSSLVFVSYLN